jgi:hypothetical protein
MKNFSKTFVLILLAASTLGVAGCHRHNRVAKADPIVGAWLVKEADAPFPYHMYVFNADGTMQQANPDAGDPHTSDSDGKGVWIRDGITIKGKWMEVLADRTTHKYAGRLELSFSVKVTGDNFTGTASAQGFDANEVQNLAPTKPGPLDGKRVTLP